jgi:hypothetical protein
MIANSSALLFACGMTGGIAYLFGLLQSSRDNKMIVEAASKLAAYTSELEIENTNLRAAGDETAQGSGYPSTARRSHLKVVK